MAKGYHSRSPEELKEYLESLNKKTKKRNWVQVLILADIIILLFVFYMISKKITPDMEIIFKPSNKIQVKDFESYFIKSNESEKKSVSYFLFITKLVNTPIQFPIQDMKIQFSLNTSQQEICLQKELVFPSKLISHKESFRFSIEASEVVPTETCKKFFEKVEFRSWKNLLAEKTLKFYPEIDIVYEKKITKMRVE